MTVLLTLIGLLVGAATGNLAGALIGAAAGGALGLGRTQKRKLDELRERVSRLSSEVQRARQVSDANAQPSAASREEPSAPTPTTTPSAPQEEPSASVASAQRSAAQKFIAAVMQTPQHVQQQAAAEADRDDQNWPGTAPQRAAPTRRAPRSASQLEQFVERGGGRLREFFTGGNSVVRVGLLVLLVGVVLLLKYAAEHSMFPVEMRMGGAALIGFVLVGIGLRQRLTRPGFGLTLQGGGVATLYLVIFFSFRVYELLPAALAFSLLVGVAIFSAVLAVSQNSLALIVIGVLGGFMAPVLASTGAGNHVALFSYYLILNLLIVGVACFRSWRPLNLLGFAFTFGIGSTWGALRYRPEDFASTEPFLIAFFLLYVGIVIIFAWRRPAYLRGWVDGSLTFGTPLAVLVLQYAMVKQRPLGMAFTTFGMAVVYLGIASVLFKRAPKLMRNLVEAFLVLGVGFATLAVPYGFSNQSLTGATWAIEGLGLFWLGQRQKRTISRIAGLLLQPLAGMALCWSLLHSTADEGLPVLNAPFAAFGFLTLASLALAYLAHRHRQDSPAWLKPMALFIPWAVIWWGIGGLREVFEHVDTEYRAAALLGFWTASALSFELLGKRLRWRNGRLPALLLVPLLSLLLLSAYHFGWVALNLSPAPGHLHSGFEPALTINPLANGGWLAWPLSMLGMGFTLSRFARDHAGFLKQVHALALWVVALFIALLLGYAARTTQGLGGNWPVAALGAGLLLVQGAASGLRPRIACEELRRLYLYLGSGGLILALGIWQVRTNILASGAVEPLPYIPLLNVLDVTLGLALLACGFWARAVKLDARPALWLMAFLWFNGMLTRTVYHNTEVAFDAQSLWRSVPLQVALSVSWALIGLATILLATRARSRTTWFSGSALLGVVVGKLFLLDLAQLSPVSKIGTFLVVGALLLVVGYFSPIPPSVPQESLAPENPSESPPD